MNKTESIARRIFGWKLNRWDLWYDYENRRFVPISEFQPEKNLAHAMLIIDKLKEHGFTYIKKDECEVCFDNICKTGDTLEQAITNAAYVIADNGPSLADELI